jgi:predicted CoA-binding protein
MTTQKQITDFLANDPIAMAGVSRNTKKFGYTAYKELKGKGLNLIPINPNTDEIDGEKSFRSVSDLPDNVKALLVFTKKDQTKLLVQEAKKKGIKHIWIQQMSDTPEAIAELNGTDINLITKQCIMMYHEPHSIHKFHRGLKKLFGALPK